MSEWQPIETVPEDRDVLMWIRGRRADEQWIMELSDNPVNTADFERRIVMGKHRCAYSSLMIATHWTPLPSPPTSASKEPT